MHDLVVVLKDHTSARTLDLKIRAHDHELAHDWLQALDKLLREGNHLHKSFCFLGFANGSRDIKFLCDRLNRVVSEINAYDWSQHGLPQYIIQDWYDDPVVRFGNQFRVPENLTYETSKQLLTLSVKEDVMNRLHNHFERLQGTVDDPSDYFMAAPYWMRRRIGQLNTICHELENRINSERLAFIAPEWQRPSQIMSFNRAERHDLKDSHRELFDINGFDRRLGHVYMHWAQIGKTLFEVWRDENAPFLDDTTCEAITHLKFYSGEFDIEWGRDIVSGQYDWHDAEIESFHDWLQVNGMDPRDRNLSLGHLPLAEIDLQQAFGTKEHTEIWRILSQHLDVCRIELGDVVRDYDYTWRDEDV